MNKKILFQIWFISLLFFVLNFITSPIKYTIFTIGFIILIIVTVSVNKEMTKIQKSEYDVKEIEKINRDYTHEIHIQLTKIKELENILQEFSEISDKDLNKIIFLENSIKKADGGEFLDFSAQLNQTKKDLIALENEIRELKNRQEENISIQRQQIAELEQVLIQKRKQLVSFDEQLDLESFALYTPKFDFIHSSEYKTQLDSLREQQKQMIKNKKAIFIPQGSTLNNNVAAGKKMLNDLSKLLLRAFNESCDTCVSSAKFNNIEVCERRIRTSFNKTNELANSLSVCISREYLTLKINELYLAYEYSVKKQQEKEVEREYKQQLREEKRLAAELEEKRKVAQKEQKHYMNALKEVKNKLLSAVTVEDKENLNERKNEIEQQLVEIDINLKDIDYRESNKRAGYVYVISNMGAFGKNVYKIGMTRRLEPIERIKELSGAAVPFAFDIHAMIFSDDAPTLEKNLHQTFANNKLNLVNQRKEFFRVPLKSIENAILKNHDKTVEFINEHEAEQFRESEKLRLQAM